MGRSAIYILVLAAFPAMGVAQQFSKAQIDSLVTSIENDTAMQSLVLDAANVFGTNSFEAGGTVELIYSPEELKAYKVQVGIPHGRITNVIYYHNGTAIQIVETEEQSRWSVDAAKYDLTTLFVSFEEIITILNWSAGETRHKVNGKRTMTESRCGIFEYEPDIEFGLGLFRKETDKQQLPTKPKAH